MKIAMTIDFDLAKGIDPALLKDLLVSNGCSMAAGMDVYHSDQVIATIRDIEVNDHERVRVQ